jgi:hypothetical protein
MIFQLLNSYQRSLALTLLLLFYCSFATEVYANSHIPSGRYYPESKNNSLLLPSHKAIVENYINRGAAANPPSEKISLPNEKSKDNVLEMPEEDNGGPSKPEANSFKSVSANDLVNLFTGSFSYNIPLLDVGGYPVNIFYNGANGMEDEASWVGLGWNINPGTINRNMRGIPDDFNGSDSIKQTMKMKPNITVGGSIGASTEIMGFEKLRISAGLGVLSNNYLGPALDYNLGTNLTYSISKNAGTEKNTENAGAHKDSISGANISFGAQLSVSSRNGTTFGGSVSMGARSFADNNSVSAGIGASTAYNSRYGIKALNLYEQVTFSQHAEKQKLEKIKDDKKKRRAEVSAPINLHNSNISFTKGTYIPALRIPVTNSNYAGSFRIGGGMSGFSGAVNVNAFKQKSEIADEDTVQYKPLIGFMYSHKAYNNRDAVMDFARLNDKEVTPNTPIISAPQYAYDVFSISGEGTGGVIRAYLKDHGVMRDNFTETKDKSYAVGVDIGIPGHIGADYNQVKTPTTISDWIYGNYIKAALQIKENSKLSENVYFMNPAESSVLNENEYGRIGNAELVRFKLDGDGLNPRIASTLEKFTNASASPTLVNINEATSASRRKRTQVISMLTAGEAASIGLERELRNYSRRDPSYAYFHVASMSFQNINRVDQYKKSHHISEITVTENNGNRYVYGQPVYNLVQKDYTFTVNAVADTNDLVSFQASEAGTSSSHLNNSARKDGFVQMTETPAYASSFLLTGLLSSDYVDVSGNGISDDDLGTAVKFNYSKSARNYKWRTPVTKAGGLLAHANQGNLSNDKDDKGIITYGERESWYLHSIETKTMVAIFTLENRNDGKGVSGDFGSVDNSDTSLQRLQKIDLYNKVDIKNGGIRGAKPIKTVWFTYSYKSLKNTPGNTQTISDNSGKLTLESIYFTYYGQTRTEKDQYVFVYNEGPDYKINSMDRWGTYKPKTDNPAGLKNSLYPYSVQDSTKAADNSKAWALSKVLLPSGAQIEVTYESNDYAYVQNKRAARMMSIHSLGRGNYITGSNALYDFSYPDFAENTRIHINVPLACATREDVYNLYLEGVNQLAFKIAVQMPDGKEYIPVYAHILDYGVGKFSNTIWVELKTVGGLSPLTLASLDFLRTQLPGQAFPGYDVSDDTGLETVAKMLAGMADGLKGIFKDVVSHLRGKGMARRIVLAESFVRLNEPTGKKYGGGSRVKKVVLKDNWDQLAGLYQSEYGQVYDYTTIDRWGGSEKRISSGVASYEPAIGAEENPFLEALQVADRLPLGPTSYGAIEMPVLDAFFPAPVVGYSKVTVYSVNKFKVPVDKKTRSGIGKQVTEFYTAKDFPVKYKHTLIDRTAEKYFRDQNKLWEFFASYSMEARAVTQGFMVELNDMHGKVKSQSSYGEEDENTPINYAGYFYKNTGERGMEDKFDFAHYQSGGEIHKGNMGIDIELMTDTREFTVKAQSTNVQAQLEWMIVVPPIWLPMVLATIGDHTNEYRAVTTTKVVNYKAVMDSMVVIDKGSVVTTKNLVYDSETGAVIVNRINNEFDDPVYSTTYPAYWAYEGMGPAYKNIGAVYSNVYFRDGKIVSGMTAAEIKNSFESGDELYVLSSSIPDDLCGKELAGIYSPLNIKKIWAVDRKKNIDSVNIFTPDLVFITADGTFYTSVNTSFRIVRSGKRNMLAEQLNSVISLTSPVNSSTNKLLFDATARVINSSATSYKEIWQNDKDVFRTGIYILNTHTCSFDFIQNCTGDFEHINPYLKGLLGNFKAYKTYAFQADRDQASITTQLSNLRNDGAIIAFTPYWSYNAQSKLVPSTDARWIWTNELTRVNARGLGLESLNPLGIYTGSQYGYHKNMVVAVAANSRYQEMAYIGFESEMYDSVMNRNVFNVCSNDQFIVQNKSSIVLAEIENIKAHSGAYVAKVNQQQNFVMNSNISISDHSNYSYKTGYYNRDTVRNLIDSGYYVDNVYMTGHYNHLPSQTVLNNWMQNTFYASPSGPPLGLYIDYNINNLVPPTALNDVEPYILHYQTNQYFSISEDGEYSIDLIPVPYGVAGSDSSVVITLRILDENNSPIYNFVKYHPDGPRYNVKLCKGTYKLELYVRDSLKYWNYLQNNWVIKERTIIYYNAGMPSGSYKSLMTTSSCSYSKPVTITDSAMNPSFTLPQNKKMIISGWVSETCSSSGCVYDNYNNAKIRLEFRNSTGAIIRTDNFSTSGPILEKWQKIEQEFTVPEDAVSASLVLVNEGTGIAAYFDDIRIHPYDAQMNTYVYDPLRLNLVAQQDENNYTTYFDYDEEGTLIRTRVETERGIKTISENRSHKQTTVKTIQ